MWAVFFLLYPGYILFFCLHFAYAVAVSAYAGLLCLDLPTRAYTCRYIFDFAYTWPAFGASVGSAFCLVFSCFAYAGLGRYGHFVPIKVVPNRRDDRPKGLKGAKKADSAYAMPTPSLRDERRTNVACLFVCWPSFPSNSMPSNSVPSISHLQHSLRK